MRSTAEFDLPLECLRQELASSDLLAGAYAHFRPLVADAIVFFLRQLSPKRLRALLAAQLSLPPNASPPERLVHLLQQVPVLHKLGQVVARDPRLNTPFRKELQTLESLQPRTSAAGCAALLDRECRGWRKTGVALGPTALAEGSVAVVMPFTWPQKRRGTPAIEGVFKLLKPGVAARLEEDLRVLARLGDFLDEHCEKYHLPRIQYADTLETIRKLLVHEVRLEQEQQHLAAAAQTYAAVGRVVVPELLPFCSPRLTAMRKVDGCKLASLPAGAQSVRKQLGCVAVEALLAHPLFCTDANALFHADPHSGNLIATPDGKLALLDWSLVGHLSKENRIHLTQLLLGGMALDPAAMGQAVLALAEHIPSAAAVRPVLEASLARLRWGAFPSVGWLLELLDSLVTDSAVRFKNNLLLFRKVLLTLEGVLADVSRTDTAHAVRIMDQVLLGRFVAESMAEWPARCWVWPGFRAFRTHISNSDVVRLLWSRPLALGRWWDQIARGFGQALWRPSYT